jgi:hypothetical protein
LRRLLRRLLREQCGAAQNAGSAECRAEAIHHGRF